MKWPTRRGTEEARNAEQRKEEILWAWELHKEADNLLHQRLNGFVAVNAFLAAGYFFATEAAYDRKLAHGFVLGISAFGVALAPLFFGVIRRLVRGIKHLKQEHLFHDPIYARYFGKRPKGPFVYWFAYGVPAILMLLWGAALGYTLLSGPPPKISARHAETVGSPPSPRPMSSQAARTRSSPEPETPSTPTKTTPPR